MTNATTSKATSTAGLNRNHRSRACSTIAAILLGATALGALSLPASAANLDVNKELMNYLNAHDTQRHYALANKGINGANWEITKVQLSRLRAPPVTLKRPRGPYKAIAIKGAAICPSQNNNQTTEVMQQIEWIEAVTDSHTTHKSDTVTTGGEVGVEISVGFGIGPVKGDSKITAKVHHEKSHKSGDSDTSSTTKTLRERSAVTLTGIGGKWAVLWARVHKAKDIPYSAVFEPVASDLVTFTVKRRGKACMYQHPGYGGRKLCFGPGESSPRLRNHKFNDEASAVRVTHGLKANFFQKTNYGGKNWEVTGDHPRLHNWLNDGFSSIKVGGSAKTKVIRVPYHQIKSHIPAKLRKFKLTGKISVNLTQSKQTLFAAKDMNTAEFQEFCFLTGGVTGSTAKSMPGLRSMPVPGGKKSKKTAGQMVSVQDMPASAAMIKKLKLKAPKK